MSPTRLLATDLDGTFIGDDPAMHDLWEDVEASGITVAFSTGRHIPSIEQFYRERHVERRAAACVCMVGTEVWFYHEGEYHFDRGWSRYISDGWNKNVVEDILRGFPEIRIQADEWQSEFKASYYLQRNADLTVAEIRQCLEEREVRAKVIYSASRFLDLLPYRSGKGGAVRYVADKLGIQQVTTAGDTGNDLDMMRADLGFHCIVVGNATEELRKVDEAHIYLATADYAAGIREGLEHFGWLAGGSAQDSGTAGR